MPTPFMHLQIAEDMRNQVENGEDCRLFQLLKREWPAFYLGSVAADFQTICDVPRAKTHFYDLPPAPDNKAYPVMLAKYPELGDAASMPPGKALFVAAYLVHLMLDLLWFRKILMPYFVEASDWGDFPQRHLAHNILLAYLDKLAYDSLPDTAADVLAAARPQKWLPFATDSALIEWRDLLVAQLQPGATLQTVEIYADRLRMSSDEFARKLEDSTWMEAQVFNKIPVDEVQTKLVAAVPQCIDLITDYLKING